ncbi:hypothetical protein JDV02_008227 [Purpureocillium takamizusanense]|uniref:Uncharacterized protein n=1 Tax=Purpureocillium takamizusanense TaxID=2060973 RepID=A0A9Q8QMB5_9HYPO|nr:uncharacterized protein JDV02_008227 [Purpureocillium takamizusanense]UNI22328.1 hypothetical protein JDV02_008227 [Purpureocillium takamizusanense]
MKFILLSIAALCAPAVMGMALPSFNNEDMESDHHPSVLSKNAKNHCYLTPECKRVFDSRTGYRSNADADAAQAGHAKGSHSSQSEAANSLTEEHSKCVQEFGRCGYNLKKLGLN